MEGLPKLPGLDFENRIKLNHHLPHSLEYVNGYRVPREPSSGIGGERLKAESCEFSSGVNDPILYDPILTYGRVKHPPVPPFRPHFVLYDKMCLTFFAFFKQSVPESPDENYKIRHVNIIFFLEDNSITVMEPCVKNSGFKQGRLVARSKIAKNIRGDLYSWKDFNIGMDIEFNGIVFHIYDCDGYTKEFLASQGIEVNEVEVAPADPIMTERFINKDRKTRKTKQVDDKLRRYLEFQGNVLQFDVALDETDIPFGECLTYKMFYYLEDDTVSVKELRENREGRDHFPMLLRKTKLPKNWKRQPVSFPAVYLEVSDAEVNEYYQPKDFRVGGTIFVFGRRFLILDCDKYTRKYYNEVLKNPQGDRLGIKYPDKKICQRALPEYIGLGTPEDSLTSCFGLVPKPPKKDVVTYLLNAHKYLRYGCVLDTEHPEDKIRKFILSYSLADGTITIAEPPIRNSGILGGKFLSSTKIWRPGCDPNNPDYYNAKDIYIGAILTINAHRFRVVDVDLYVYNYMLEHPEYFTKEVMDNVKKYHLLNGNLKEELKYAMAKECLKENEEQAQQPAEPSPASTYEECLKQITVVKEEEMKRKPIQPMIKSNPDYKGGQNECPLIVDDPSNKPEKTILVHDDKCKDRFLSTACNNPHKIVRFKE